MTTLPTLPPAARRLTVTASAVDQVEPPPTGPGELKDPSASLLDLRRFPVLVTFEYVAGPGQPSAYIGHLVVTHYAAGVLRDVCLFLAALKATRARLEIVWAALHDYTPPASGLPLSELRKMLSLAGLA